MTVMIYYTCLIPKYLKDEIKEEAERLDIKESEVIERRYFGYELQEEIANEAKVALKKYANSEERRYEIIEKWWKKKTRIDKSCQDILREEMKK